MSDDVLELSALSPVRPKASLKTDDDPEGTIYELAVPEDFGAADLSRLGVMFQEVEELAGLDNLTPAKAKRLERVLDSLAARLIVDAPAADVAKLPAVVKRGLALRFFSQAGTRLMPFMEGFASPSGSSSPASNGSMAGSPAPGSN